MGFMIAFIVGALWGQVGDADAVVRKEGAAAIQIARELDVFAQADSDRIRESLLAYQNAALDEWPQAINGRITPEAEKALADLESVLETTKPVDDKQRSALNSALDSVKEIGSSRTERIVMARTNVGPPMSLWSVIFLTSALLQFCEQTRASVGSLQSQRGEHDERNTAVHRHWACEMVGGGRDSGGIGRGRLHRDGRGLRRRRVGLGGRHRQPVGCFRSR